MIRNEVDLVRLNVLYNSAVGIERRLIVDNGSMDGTDMELWKLSRRDPRVRWTRDEGPYRQTEIHTELAREAYRDGADWVVQIDADEFWYAPKDDLKSVLAKPEAGILRAQILNSIPAPRAEGRRTAEHLEARGLCPVEISPSSHRGRPSFFTTKPRNSRANIARRRFS